MDLWQWLCHWFYIGCYLVAFHKAAPHLIDEKCFEGLIRNHTLANGDEYCDFHVSRKEL